MKPANLATTATIARELMVGTDALKRTIDRAYHAGNLALAYTKTPEGTVYDVEVVKLAVAPHLPELRERWAKSRAEEAARAQTAGPSKPHTSAFPPRSLGNPSPSRPATPRRKGPEPEVIVLRRRMGT